MTRAGRRADEKASGQGKVPVAVPVPVKGTGTGDFSYGEAFTTKRISRFRCASGIAAPRPHTATVFFERRRGWCPPEGRLERLAERLGGVKLSADEYHGERGVEFEFSSRSAAAAFLVEAQGLGAEGMVDVMEAPMD